jgi:protein involved in polysaccharide export with SLBB domain
LAVCKNELKFGSHKVLKKLLRIVMFLSVIFTITFTQNLKSQDVLGVEEGSIIELELQKLQQDFQQGSSDQAIPPSKLLEELQKPGNEHLLEQLKNGELLKKQESIEQDLNDLKEKIESEGTENEDETEDEKKKRLISLEEDEKLNFSSASEMYFDREIYYQSIREFYGYKIFVRNEYSWKEPAKVQLYSPRNTAYIIGPGDSFILTLWGDIEFTKRLVVSAEGTIYLEKVGVIPVHGLTVTELESKLRNWISRVYSTIDPPDGKPTTHFDVYFDKINIVNVFVTGEVVSQGTQEVNPNSTILSALIRAGGVTAKGTLRNIQLIRDGKVVRVFDLYDYIQKGKDVSESVLQNGDNIFVGTRMNTVELQGEVINPLKYELKAEETLADLI